MKQNRKNHIFGWMAASVLMLTAACSDNVTLDMPQGNVNGTNVVTFTVQPQQLSLGTRADKDIETHNKTISDGSDADVLIFAVYEENEDGTFKVAEEFGKGSQVPGFSVANGQNAIKVDEYPVTIQLVFTDEEKKYKVAFWAQNSTTTAYDTQNLQEVKVIYEEAKNNDELRDAFCAVSKTIGFNTKNEDVILRRPLAQVNVGTAGWDYEGAALIPSPYVLYTQSKIELEGVAQYYDIIAGKALCDEEKYPKTDAIFKFNTLPAFIQIPDLSGLTCTPQENEEYLSVDLDKNKEIDNDKKYKGWADFNKYKTDEETKADYYAGKFPDTEVFKYLSMCYVLVPEGNAEEATPEETPTTPEGDDVPAEEGEGEEDNQGSTETPDDPNYTYNGSTLNTVKFSIKGIELDKDGNRLQITDEENNTTTDKESEENTVFTINNVPVQKNWRTNILGNSFFITGTKFYVDVVPEYMGDYNNIFKSDENVWPGDTFSVDFTTQNQKKEYYTPYGGTKQSHTGFFQYANNDAWGTGGKYTGTYNDKDFNVALKVVNATTISFTTDLPATVLIAECSMINGIENSNTIKFDGIQQEISSATTPQNSTNVRLYTINVTAGEHKITRGEGGESGLVYVEVRIIDENTKNEGNTFPDDLEDDYYGN